MTKEEINKFKISGQIYLWKFLENQRNYPGWNLTADKTGCESSLQLLEMMKQTEWSSKKEIQTAVPTELQIRVPNNRNGDAKWKYAKTLILNYKKKSASDEWMIAENSDTVEIRFGTDKLTEFENSILKVQKGTGDFAISNFEENDSHILYFWWNLKN